MIEKKILVIMGSPRKGNTYRACDELRGALEKELAVEFEYLWLTDAALLPCRGCGACFVNGEDRCPIRDDAALIVQKMQNADGVVFASPVYGMNVTGQMKSFIDRLSFNFHRPQFFEKKALLLATAGMLGHGVVLKYPGMVARQWGFEVAGSAGIVTPDPLPPHRASKNREVITRAAAEFAGALRRPARRSPGLRDVVMFHGQRAAFSQMESVFPADHRFWTEKGWFGRDARYFVDVPVNPLYHAIGKAVGWLSTRQMRKDLVAEGGGA